MNWRNPFAFAGLILLAGPILIHLLARHNARVMRFPTLRFIDSSRLQPTRRTRITDPILLALRMLILATAVAALARPVFGTAERKQRIARTWSRAIIVDTSASMRRTLGTGRAAVDSARSIARAEQRASAAALVIESATPARDISGAAAWLATQPGMREIVIISDFQTGTIDSVDIAAVPAARLVQIAGITDPTEPPADTRSDVVVLAATDEADEAAAATRAASSLTPSLAGVILPIAVIFPRHESYSALRAAAKPVDQPWMGEFMLRMRTDPLLTEVGKGSSLIAQSGHAAVQGVDRVLVFTRAAPASLEGAAVIAAALRASIVAPPAVERERDVIDAATLIRWQRPAAPAVSRAGAAGDDESDGRWLWLAVLALLVLESVLRRHVD